MNTLSKYLTAICLYALCASACSKDDQPSTPPAPVIVNTSLTSFVPGTATAGDPIKITGNKFTGATAVMIGNTPAQSFQVISDTVIMAYVATTGVSSGKIAVTTPLGKAETAGFTYYTPVSYSLSGTTRYASLDKFYSRPQGGYEVDSSDYKTYDRAENCTITIRQINPNDVDRNASATEFFSTASTYKVRSRYTDSANYVILSGVVDEATHGITGIVYGQAYSFTNTSREWSSVFARIEGSVITIPRQFPLNGYVYITGSGELKNGVLKLNYFMDDTRGNSKTGNLISH
jgi:hypothetical protein